MILKKLSVALAVLLGLVTLAPAFALAQTSVGVSASTSVTAGVAITAAQSKAKTRGDNEIDRRVAALNDLNTRVQAMQRVSDAFKQSLNTTVGTELSDLTALKTKIDADTDGATLKTDLQSITASYRIYALILPQGRIAAAADRVATIVTMFSTLGSKLQARVQAAGTAGNDITAMSAALTDMSSQLNDAQTQAQNAISSSATLQPDNGVASVMASNTASLKQARGDITTAQKDLVAARKDVNTIVNDLKNVKVPATASSTTQTTTQ